MPRQRREKLIAKAQEALSPVIERAIEEELKNQERIPGRVVNGQKTPFTDADLVAIHGITTFIPEETVMVSCNGVRYQLFADREMTVPKNIYNQYTEYRRRKRQSVRNLAALGIESLGAGGLSPDINNP